MKRFNWYTTPESINDKSMMTIVEGIETDWFMV